MVLEAAAKAGMTREEFERLAIEQASAQALGLPGPIEARKGSGERRALTPGRYSMTEEPLAAPARQSTRAPRRAG
jgi:hypothetical protein